MLAAAPHRHSPLCWQGWRLDLPERWNPVKLEGDASRGMILLADLHRPRLGVRWQTLKKKADPNKAVLKAMLAEVGQLAASESQLVTPGDGWQVGRLYLDPEPPGRDVWIGYSPATRRLIEVVHHVRRRDRILRETILPTLVDQPAGEPGEWSIFDLRCQLPAGAKLTKHRLNVGDLTLEFTVDRRPLVAREIAVASVALTRQPLARWLAAQQSPRSKFYRPAEQPQPLEWKIGEQTFTGFRRRLVRRRRHFLMRWKSKSLVGVALHDLIRDKLLIYEAADEATIRRVVENKAAQEDS